MRMFMSGWCAALAFAAATERYWAAALICAALAFICLIPEPKHPQRTAPHE